MKKNKDVGDESTIEESIKNILKIEEIDKKLKSGIKYEIEFKWVILMYLEVYLN